MSDKMFFWRRKIPKAYQVEDLPKDADGNVMAATFLSNPKNPSLRVILESIQETVHQLAGQDTEVKRVAGTGMKAIFSGHQFHTSNKKTMLAMLNHRAFNDGRMGFAIDHHDPTGLWRHLGIVEETVVKTFVPKVMHKVEDSPDAITKKLNAAMKAPPEKAETLVGLAGE